MGEFALYGAPLSLSNTGSWDLYNKDKKNFYEIHGGLPSQSPYNDGRAYNFWSNYLPFLSQELGESSTINNNPTGNVPVIR